MKATNILGAIGNTPLVKLNKVASALSCDLYGKCEYLNPGGSVKDRIALNMIEAAEKSGHIQPGDTLIEPTSGNTGVGIALAAAVKGYKVIITLPEKMSHEKQVVMEALGATIYRTPTDVPSDHPDSHISLAKRLQAQIPRAHILDQYSNPNNPSAHYAHTAEEIYDDLGESLAMVVIAVGTGGTLTGVARKLKQLNPDIQIIGVDPYGSVLGGGTEVCPYDIEGIGYDFMPDVLDNSLVDRYIKINDQEAFTMARRLIKEEGLLVGGSSGANVWAAIHAAKSLNPGQSCVTFLCDSIRNYLTKFVDDKWMQEQGYTIETTMSETDHANEDANLSS